MENNTINFDKLIEQAVDPQTKNQVKMALAVVKLVAESGGRTLIVGGYVRDLLLKDLGYSVEPKDIDLEVYGLAYDKIRELLEPLGPVNVVGAQFSVIKFGDLDIALPRRESKIGKGHRGFAITGEPDLSFSEASKRRDFTINALALDLLTGEIIDAHGGIDDLEEGVLQATDPETFGDDPLRALRAMQFVGRFNLRIEAKTADLCRGLELSELSPERIGDEWKKLLLKSEKPSKGLSLALDLGIINKLHPELLELVGTPQSVRWHPEGDVWTHTLMVVDEAAKLIRQKNFDEKRSLIFMFFALTHDMGKPVTTVVEDEKVTSYGHAKAGIQPAEKFMRSLSLPDEMIKHVLLLAGEHMYPAFNKDLSDAAIRRLALRLAPATIEELVWSSEVDRRGRAIPWHGFPEGEALLERAKQLSLEDTKPKPLVMGRHLIELGLEPGPGFGQVLDELFEAQLEGKFSTVEEGIEYYKNEGESRG
ncbi:MAG: HDIG domain-containing metalloprotein [Patescibacteria group bacterium]|jgi:tRNA nucleotidyltransferase (CCA-adding enzyme)